MLYIISAPYYEDISNWLEAGAVAACEEAGHDYKIIRVAGALEIPQAINIIQKKALKPLNDNAPQTAGKPMGFIALGCVIRGETSHYDVVCETSALGLQQVALTHNIPVTNGILTVENKEQAEARAHPERGNKGGFAVEACLDLAKLKFINLQKAPV